VLGLHFLSNSLRRLQLLGAVIEDSGTILGSLIVSLGVYGRRIVRSVEVFDEFRIADYAWIKLDPECFSVAGTSAANLLIGRVGAGIVSTGIANSCLQYPLVLGNRVVFQEDMFNSPETSSSESSDFWCASRHSYRTDTAAVLKLD